MSLQTEIPLMKNEVSGRGEPLVLVPGGFTGWLSWIPHADELAAAYRVVRVQLHNVEFGLSDTPLPPGYSIDFEVNALRKTLDDLGIEHADIAGWSYGSKIALSFALLYPHRVRTLTLIEPSEYWILPSRGLSLSQQILDEQQFYQTLPKHNVSEEHLIAFMRVAALLPQDVDPQSLPQWPLWLKHRQSLRIGDIEFRHINDVELVRQFQKPVLLVRGEDSNRSTHDIVNVLAEELPNAQVITLPGGHAPHIESMQPFLEELTRFLSEASTTS